MTQTGSTALIVVGWLAVAVGAASAAWIAWDVFGAGHRQRMAIMNLVWPITGLYLGPVAIWAYRRQERLDGTVPDEEPAGWWAYARANWWPISKGVSHCGAGCTLGDIIGEWVVYATALSIPLFGTEDADALMAMYAVTFVLAWSIGVAFQYFSIVPMRDDLGPVAGIWAAVKADTFSIVAFQAGMFAVMALVHLVIWQPPLSVASPAYWLMMQVAMIAGFLTAWPVNAVLVRRGLKEKM